MTRIKSLQAEPAMASDVQLLIQETILAGGLMVPFQITFHEIPESDAMWDAVQKRVEKLERYFNRIESVDVRIECPHRHRTRVSERIYHVHIQVFVPGNNVVVTREKETNDAHTDAYIAIRDAFDVAERLLREKGDKMKGKVKTHAPAINNPPNQSI